MLAAAALGAAALNAPAAAQFDGLVAETQEVLFNGEPHLVVEVFAQFQSATNFVVNVYEAQITVNGAQPFLHDDVAGPTWSPNGYFPSPPANPIDSLVRVGGPIGTLASPVNTTSADPSFFPNFNQAGIPSFAGWFNSNPPNQQGLAGPGLKVPITRFLLKFDQPLTLKYKGSLSWGAPLGQPSFDVEWLFEPNALEPCEVILPLVGGGVTEFSTVNLTATGLEACAPVGPDMWFAYTPTVTGFSFVTTQGSDFDTVLSIYEGCDACPPAPSQLIDCNDDAGDNTWSERAPFVFTDTCYLIRVAGKDGATGNGVLTIFEAPDCNGNGIADGNDISNGVEADCNLNGVPDSCEIANGLPDTNGNGVPDICEFPPGVVVGPIVNPANCAQYYLLESSSWTLAQSAAEALGGNLATIEDAAENTWVWQTFSPFSGGLWIGFNDIDVEGVFVWVDGSPGTFTSWSANEPNNAGGNEDCVQIFPTGGGTIVWNDLPCGVTLSGVVKIPGGVADLNGDGIVDGADLGLLLNAWGTAGPAGDLNCSGSVDGADLGLLLNAWGD